MSDTPRSLSVAGVDATVHRDTAIASGDPVCVYDPATGTAHSLGTGFESLEALAIELEFAVENGSASRNIPPETAAKLESCERLEIFTLSTTIHQINR